MVIFLKYCIVRVFQLLCVFSATLIYIFDFPVFFFSLYRSLLCFDLIIVLSFLYFAFLLYYCLLCLEVVAFLRNPPHNADGDRMLTAPSTSVTKIFYLRHRLPLCINCGNLQEHDVLSSAHLLLIMRSWLPQCCRHVRGCGWREHCDPVHQRYAAMIGLSPLEILGGMQGMSGDVVRLLRFEGFDGFDWAARSM